MNEKQLEKTLSESVLKDIEARVPHAKSSVAPVNDPGLDPNVIVRAVLPTKVTGYEELDRILKLAYDQAANGKGKARHSKQAIGFRPWHEQPIMQIGRMTGPGYHTGQVQKKVQEAVTMAGNADFTGAKAEALGAIVYAAAFFKLLEEMEQAHLM